MDEAGLDIAGQPEGTAVNVGRGGGRSPGRRCCWPLSQGLLSPSLGCGAVGCRAICHSWTCSAVGVGSVGLPFGLCPCWESIAAILRAAGAAGCSSSWGRLSWAAADVDNCGPTDQASTFDSDKRDLLPSSEKYCM